MKLRNPYMIRAASRFAPSQWEMALLCNDVSHRLDASLGSALHDRIWQESDGWCNSPNSKYFEIKDSQFHDTGLILKWLCLAFVFSDFGQLNLFSFSECLITILFLSHSEPALTISKPQDCQEKEEEGRRCSNRRCHPGSRCCWTLRRPWPWVPLVGDWGVSLLEDVGTIMLGAN